MCEPRTALCSAVAAALPRTHRKSDSLTFAWMVRSHQLSQTPPPPFPVCLSPQGDIDPGGTFSVLRPVDRQPAIWVQGYCSTVLLLWLLSLMHTDILILFCPVLKKNAVILNVTDFSYVRQHHMQHDHVVLSPSCLSHFATPTTHHLAVCYP